MLNGGFGGHAWGDACFGGVAFWIDKKYPIRASKYQQKHALSKWKSYTMRNIKDFILDKAHVYQVLKPASDNKSFALGLYTKGSLATFIKALKPESDYLFEWWHVEEGGWHGATMIRSGGSGKLNGDVVSDTSRNWGYRRRIKGYAPDNTD